MTIDELRQKVQQQAQGAMALQVAFLGVVNQLFESLEVLKAASALELARQAKLDPGYVQRWCEVAYAFGYLELEENGFQLSALGEAFLPNAAGSLMPFAIRSVLGAHVFERAAGLMHSGERPGEAVLAERSSILPWYGAMMEVDYGPVFDREVLPLVPAYSEVDKRAGLVVELGCGTGWYLRKLAQRYAKLRGLGLDGISENIVHARQRASNEGLSSRLTFELGDIYHYQSQQSADLIAMNRSLHHVWDQKAQIFSALREALRPDGYAVIWEPAWSDELQRLREPRRPGMAFQNLSEHVQGNHFLRPEEIEAAFRQVNMQPQTFLIAQGAEAIVVGQRKE